MRKPGARNFWTGARNTSRTCKNRMAGFRWRDWSGWTRRHFVWSAAESKIHLANSPAAHLGVLELKDGVVRLVAPAEGFPQGFLVTGKPATSQVLSADADNDKNAVHMTSGL